MSLNGPTKIISDRSRAAQGGPRLVVVSSLPSARVQQVAAALAADALAAGALGGRSPDVTVRRAADPAHLEARQTALAAALQEWSGTASRTLRTTALAVLAASRTAGVVQEATRAAQTRGEETVFEAFFRGVEGFASAELQTGRGGQE